MTKPEEKFWTMVRKGMGTGWRAKRIENRIDAGTPDVLYSIDGTLGMVELKVQTPTKSQRLNARHYTQEQRDFATYFGGRIYLLLWTGDEMMIFGSTLANEILRGQTIEWHRSVAVWHGTSFDQLLAALSRSPYPSS